MQRTTIGAIALTGIVIITGGWQLLHRGSTTPETPKATVTTQGNVLAVSAPTTEPHSAVEAIDGNRSKVGAARAAVRFLELDERLFPSVSPEASRALSDSITSTGSRKRLGDRAEAHQQEILTKGDLEGLTLRLAPISTRVRKYNDTSATVDIFLLRLWSFPTKGALDDYATAELKLVWENNEWRLNDSSVIDGPYPVARFSARPTLASTAAQYEQTLAGFDDQDLLP
jgi:hypothetical protein